MTESGYYPMGAEFDKNAPYNQVDPEPIEIEEDETGKYRNIDFSVCDLDTAVKEQVYLPQDSCFIFDNYINKGSKSKSESAYKEAKKILDDLSGWNVDEMEVIRNTKG